MIADRWCWSPVEFRHRAAHRLQYGYAACRGDGQRPVMLRPFTGRAAAMMRASTNELTVLCEFLLREMKVVGDQVAIPPRVVALLRRCLARFHKPLAEDRKHAVERLHHITREPTHDVGIVGNSPTPSGPRGITPTSSGVLFSSGPRALSTPNLRAISTVLRRATHLQWVAAPARRLTPQSLTTGLVERGQRIGLIARQTAANMRCKSSAASRSPL